MHSFNIICLATIATFVAAVDITCNTDVFSRSSNPNFKLLPKDFNELESKISPDSPLLLFIRSGQGSHDKSSKFANIYQRMKQNVRRSTTGDCSDEDRLYYFDPDLDESGVKQAHQLKDQLHSSGWIQFLDRVSNVQYLASPLSRAIETALQAMPNSKIVVDEGVRPRITPLGIDLRRPLNCPLTLGEQTFESAQIKFKDFKDRLVFKMADLHSDNVYDKFGYYSDEDPNIKNGAMESDEDLDARITKWLEMLRPRRENQSTVTKVMDKILPDPIQTKLTNLPPKVYVIFTNQNFISGILNRFNLKAYQEQNNQLNFCEVVPILLEYGRSPNSSSNY